MSAEMVQIRNADPKELGTLALVTARANAQRDGESLPTAVESGGLRDLSERMSRPNVWTYVAVDEGEIAGFALGYPLTDKDVSPDAADTEYLSLLMMEPNFWGKGIAGKLLDIVASKARDAGRRRLTLRTRDEDNEHARGVYEHKGFVLTGVTKESQYGRQVECELDLSNPAQ